MSGRKVRGRKKARSRKSGKSVKRRPLKVEKRVRRRPIRKKKPANPIVILPLFVSAFLLLGSMTIPWGGLDVKTKIGIIPVTLDAEVYEYGVSYEADLSGTEGLIGGNANISQKLSDERVFITGLGEFQETIGFVKGSSKFRNHTIELYTTPENKAKVAIETYVDNIPWWPVGMAQEVSVSVSIVEPPNNMSKVTIKKVWIELHRTIDGKDNYKEVWSQEPDNELKKLGAKQTYTTSVKVDEDFGHFFVVGRATLEFIDSNGISNRGRELRSFTGNPKMVDLWTISNERTARIAMLLASAPITATAAALLMISAVAFLLRKRWAWKVATAGAVLGILSIIFFILGVYALIDLTGYADWFGWNMIGIGLAFTGAGFGIAATALVFLATPKVAKRTKRKRRGGTSQGPRRRPGTRPRRRLYEEE